MEPICAGWGTFLGDAAAGYVSRVGTLSIGPNLLAAPAWGGFAEALAFFDPAGGPSDVADLPRAANFSFINMGVFRGPWLAPKELQTYLGFKLPWLQGRKQWLEPQPFGPGQLCV